MNDDRPPDERVAGRQSVALAEVGYVTPTVRELLGTERLVTRTDGSAFGIGLRGPETVALLELDAAVDARAGADGRGVVANEVDETVDDAVGAVEERLDADFRDAHVVTVPEAHGGSPRLDGGPADAVAALEERGMTVTADLDPVGGKSPGKRLAVSYEDGGPPSDRWVDRPRSGGHATPARSVTDVHARGGPLLWDRTERELARRFGRVADDVRTVGTVVREGRSEEPGVGTVGLGAGEVGYLAAGDGLDADRLETVPDPLGVALVGETAVGMLRPPVPETGFLDRVVGRQPDGGVAAAVATVEAGVEEGFDRAVVATVGDPTADRDLGDGLAAVHDALAERGLDVETVAGVASGDRWLGVDRTGTVYRSAYGRSRIGAAGLDRFPSDRMADLGSAVTATVEAREPAVPSDDGGDGRTAGR